MRHSLRRYIKWIHLWLSLPAGVIISLVCLTGAMLVYQPEIERIVFPERFLNLPSNSGQLDWNSCLELAEKQLSDDSIIAISFSNDPLQTATFQLASAPRIYASVNRATGEVQSIYNTRTDFFYTIKKLHRWLLDESRTVGRIIVGTSSLFLALILCTGFAVWMPKHSKTWVKRLKVVTQKGTQRLLFCLHTAVGVYVMGILLLLSLTGAIWSFAWYYQGVATLFGIETVGKEPSDRPNPPLLHTTADWTNALIEIETQCKEYTLCTLRKDGKTSILTDDSVHELATNDYQYQPSDRSLSLISNYGDHRDDRFFIGWVDVLHTGRWGGPASRLLSFIAALIGTTLPLTGYLLYFRKRARKRQRKRKQVHAY